MRLLVQLTPIAACLGSLATAQRLEPQTDTWNSIFSLTDSQISSANLSETVANNVNIALRFEQTNWATGSVFKDPFYTDLPANASSAPAGSILKIESFTNTSLYTIAPTLALSRIIYQSKTLNGSLVPVSAFVLWPYYPKDGAEAAPLVSWAHGTSGIFAECGPSHVRNLLYQFAGPYELALAGYAVVATDYAGLGVPYNAEGEPIVHQWAASPAAGNDALYAAQAAHAAFPDKTTPEFVIMGHSQGGGATWAAAQTQLEAKVPGYLGAIAVSPVTSVIGLFEDAGTSLALIQAWKSLTYALPELKISEMLTPRGYELAKLTEELQTCNAALSTLLYGAISLAPTEPLTIDAWFDSHWAKEWDEITVAGGKDFAGPMLVLQGGGDAATKEPRVTHYVDLTCERFPEKEITYVVAEGVTHIPTMYATQQFWLGWLDQRFKDTKDRSTGKCTKKTIGAKTPMPFEQYQPDTNWYMSYVLSSYQL